MIVNRFDRHQVEPGRAYGVDFQLLETDFYDLAEVNVLLKLLDLRRQHYGDGAIMVDCGANIGVQTVECAKHVNSWGQVLAFEAQERIYYALAGNIAINNCFNARAIHAAVTAEPGTMKIPSPNYFRSGKFWQPGIEEAGQYGVYRPADRLFGKQPDQRARRQS